MGNTGLTSLLRFSIFIGTTVLVLSSCTLLSDHQPPKLDIPLDQPWPNSEADIAPSVAWLETFEDDALNTLVKTAISNNYNQKIAQTQVNAARARARLAAGNYWPQISAGFNAARRQSTFDIGSGVQQNLNNSFGFSLASISWEADIWGRIRDENKAAVLDYDAVRMDYHSARLSLAANVARQWFNAIEAKLQVALAEQTLANFEASLKIIDETYALGLNNALDVHLARTNVANAESTLNDQLAREDVIKRTLQILLGSYPKEPLNLPADLPDLSEPVPAGIPATLVERRPDVRAALARLDASASRVDIAKKNRLPRLSLTGSTGTASDELENLTNIDFLVWTIASNVAAPIFQGGKLKANQELAATQSDAAFYQYANTVLNALVEVESRLFAEPLLLNQERALERAVTESRAAEELAKEQYGAGLVDIVTLLETQRRLFNSDSNLLRLRNQRLQNRIDLYLALGGEYLSTPHAGSDPEE